MKLTFSSIQENAGNSGRFDRFFDTDGWAERWFGDPEEFLLGDIDTEPLDIIYDSSFNVVEAMSEYVNTYGIIALIQQIIVYGALISVLMSLIVLLFTKKSDMLTEKKQDIAHKVGIVLAGSAAVFIFSVVKSFFDNIFGMI